MKSVAKYVGIEGFDKQNRVIGPRAMYKLYWDVGSWTDQAWVPLERSIRGDEIRR